MGKDATHNSTPGSGTLQMPPAEDLVMQAVSELITGRYSSSVMDLPRETIHELGLRLVTPGKNINDAAVEWLEEKGYGLARSSVYRFAQRFCEVYKRSYRAWADKLVWMRRAADPNLKTDDLVDLIRNQTRVLIAREVMTTDVADLDTKRISMYLKLVENAETAELERNKLDLAREQAESRAAKLEAEVDRLTLENDKRRREVAAAIETVEAETAGGGATAEDVVARVRGLLGLPAHGGVA